MGYLAKSMHPHRRKADIQEWDRVVESIAMSLCPASEWQAYEGRRKQLAQKPNGKVKVFPVWRKYRGIAIKVAVVQRNIPFLKHLPMGVSKVLSQAIFR